MLDAFSVKKPIYPLVAFFSSLCMLVCGMLLSKSLWAFAFAGVLFLLCCCFGLFRGAWKMSAAMLAFGLVIGGLAFLTNRNFNALGNKKSGRTLQGSVHAKQRGENAYRRPGRTVAYIGAEFWDTVKRTNFVIAVRVESEGPMQELHPGDQTWYISEDGITLEQLPFICLLYTSPSPRDA